LNLSMLHIEDPLERTLVATADAALTALAAVRRRSAPAASAVDPKRILLLRLERIGDLVMALPAVRDVRTLAPNAGIDLVVGSWNEHLARAIPHVDRVETLDARWLARGRSGLGVIGLIKAARSWRDRRYDLAINFEPDIRSNLALSAAGAARSAGWTSGGGGPLLDVALDYDVSAHTSANAQQLVAAAFGRQAPESARPLLTIPDAAASAAALRLRALGASRGPLVGIHASGGRAIKQWDPARFAAVAAKLADERGAQIVLTGGPDDAPLVEQVKRLLSSRTVVDVSTEADLPTLAALLARLDLFITGDTGPMHLAAAVSTPVVAVFGPSKPERYAPTGTFDRVVRVDLPCSPCNRIRQPPARCVGHTPDCLAFVSVDAVYAAATSALDASAARLTRARRS
jgi:heptosyltransferase I